MTTQYVQNLTAESWEGNRRRITKTKQPSWEGIAKLVSQLDPDQVSSAILEGVDGKQLVIGGSPGHYVVHLLLPDGTLFQLRRPAAKKAADKPVSLVVGGQQSFVCAKYVLNKPTMLRAMEYFFLEGDKSPNLDWELN